MFDSPILNKVIGLLTYIGGARHALFFALPMLLIGELIGRREWKRKNFVYLLLLLVSFSLGFIEATLIKSRLGSNITFDVSIFGWMPAIPLFLIGLTNKSRMKPEKSRSLRKTTDLVYIIHIWVLTIVGRLFELEYGLKFLIITIVSFGVAIAFIFGKEKLFQKNANHGNAV